MALYPQKTHEVVLSELHSSPGSDRLTDHQYILRNSINDSKLPNSYTIDYGVGDLCDQYDYCMVLPANEQGELHAKGNEYCQRLLSYGMELYPFLGLSKTEIFVLMRVPVDQLRAFAESINFTMSLDPVALKEAGERGDPSQNIAGFTIPKSEGVTKYDPYSHIYSRYTRAVSEEVYARPMDAEHPFTGIVAVKLTGLLIEATPPGGGEPLKMRRYMNNGWVKACFPLNDSKKRRTLIDIWSRWTLLPWQEEFCNNPLVRDYFGEKVAMHFAFIGHYTYMLLIPAFVSIPCQIPPIFVNDGFGYSEPYLPFYSFAIALWAIIMLELWKRRESRLAMEWGTSKFEENEPDRSEFRGDRIQSFIDGSNIKYFSYKKRNFYVAQSMLAVFGLTLLVAGVVASIYVIRFTLQNDGVANTDAQTVASILNAVQIQIMNAVYYFIAKALNDRENHRTETEYEDSMISKIFFFQFINSYASFYYLAFFAELTGDCSGDDCMTSLGQNLGIIFGTRLVTNILLGIVIPFISFRVKYRQILKAGNGLLVRPEREFLLEKYDPMMISLDGFTNLSIQYGYTALFITALPIAATLALISNVVEVKGHAWKLLHLYQRAEPRGAQDIGQWQTIFLAISIIAVVTNAGISVFTMTTFDDRSEEVRLWTFIAFQWLCFSLQFFLMSIIPDVPTAVAIQMSRCEFLVSKIIDKVSDDKNDFGDNSPPSITIMTYPDREQHSVGRESMNINLKGLLRFQGSS